MPHAVTQQPSRRHRSLVRRLLRPRVLLPVAGVLAVVLGVALSLFQPWKLVVDQTVDEAAPTTAAAPAGGQGARSGVPAGTGGATPGAEAAPVVLATGKLLSHEHATTGSVRVLRLPDGSRVLRLEDLRTSNGPDLKVWLTDAAVRSGRGGWFVFDDGRYVDLGGLKGNVGSQNYSVPESVDLATLTSISIWCDRFNVSFGAARLEPVT